jgi:hypothetical protein
MRDVRLGDDIDDFCVRCKRIMNHAVVSVLNAAPAKVRCRTCHSDHDYRHEQAPPPKVDLRKQALFNEVLKKVDPVATVLPEEPDGADAIEVADVIEATEAAEAAEAGAEEVPVAKPKGRAKKK